jgi:uncharacterized RDD family membrane protein YckC
MPTALIFCNRCGFGSADDAQFCQRCGATLIAPAVSPSVLSSQVVAPHYAGFWIRVAAASIDFLLTFAAGFLIKLLFGSVVTLIGMRAEIPLHQLLLVRRWVRIAMGILVVFAYSAGMESSSFQATLGKLAVRLKVTDLEGKRISFARASGRYFAKWLSAFALGLGYLMVGFDEEKQGLHDRIAGTLVLYRNVTR